MGIALMFWELFEDQTSPNLGENVTFQMVSNDGTFSGMMNAWKIWLANIIVNTGMIIKPVHINL